MKMNVDEIQRPLESVPFRGMQDDTSRIPIIHLDANEGARPAKRDAHPLVVVMWFEATKGKLSRNRLGGRVAQLLGSENIDLILAFEIIEALRVSISPPQIPRNIANRNS
jgi:hypothetical protein